MTANAVIDRCASTNDLARALCEQGAAHGTWISARTQDKGRGRLGREWQSLEGNLFLSIVARVEDKSRWTWVPLATAVAVARFLERKHPALEVRIKWPNDLWVVPRGAPAATSGSKLGGILCEAVGNRSGSFVVIGLGLNCLHAPQGLDQKTASLTEALGTRLSADDIRLGVVASVVETMDELSAQGPSRIVADFERKAAFPPGSEIEWTSPGHEGSPAQHGVVRGLGPSGELLVSLPDGADSKLFAEDVKVRGRPGSTASCGSLA